MVGNFSTSLDSHMQADDGKAPMPKSNASPKQPDSRVFR
jgi:hypothetical protein